MKTCSYANKAPQLEEDCAKAIREGDLATLRYVCDEATHCYNNTSGAISDRFAAVALEAELYLRDLEPDDDLEEEEEV